MRRCAMAAGYSPVSLTPPSRLDLLRPDMSITHLVFTAVAVAAAVVFLPFLSIPGKLCFGLLMAARTLTFMFHTPRHAIATAAWVSVQLLWETLMLVGVAPLSSLGIRLYKHHVLYVILAFFEFFSQLHARHTLPEWLVLVVASVHATLFTAVFAPHATSSITLTACSFYISMVVLPRGAHRWVTNPWVTAVGPCVASQSALMPGKPPMERVEDAAASDAFGVREQVDDPSAASTEMQARSAGSRCRCSTSGATGRSPPRAMGAKEAQGPLLGKMQPKSLLAAQALVAAAANSITYASPLGQHVQASLKILHGNVGPQDMRWNAASTIAHRISSAGHSAGKPLDVLWLAVRTGCVLISGAVVLPERFPDGDAVPMAMTGHLLPDLLQQLGLGPPCEPDPEDLGGSQGGHASGTRIILQLGGTVVMGVWHDGQWHLENSSPAAGGAEGSAPDGDAQSHAVAAIGSAASAEPDTPRLGLARALPGTHAVGGPRATVRAAPQLHRVQAQVQLLWPAVVAGDVALPRVVGSTRDAAAHGDATSPTGALQLWAHTPAGYVDVAVAGDVAPGALCGLLSIELGVWEEALLRHGPMGGPIAWLQPLTLELWRGPHLLSSCILLLTAVDLGLTGGLTRTTKPDAAASELSVPPLFGWWGGASTQLAHAVVCELAQAFAVLWDASSLDGDDMTVSPRSAVFKAWAAGVDGAAILQHDLVSALLFVRQHALAAGCCVPGTGAYPAIGPALRPEQAKQVVDSLRAHARANRLPKLHALVTSCLAPWAAARHQPGMADAQARPAQLARALWTSLLGYNCPVCEATYLVWLWDTCAWVRVAGSTMLAGVGLAALRGLVAERMHVEVGLLLLWLGLHFILACKSGLFGSRGGVGPEPLPLGRTTRALAIAVASIRLVRYSSVAAGWMRFSHSTRRAMTGGVWVVWALLLENVEQGALRAACGARCTAAYAASYSAVIYTLLPPTMHSWTRAALCIASMVLVPLAMDVCMRRRRESAVRAAALTVATHAHALPPLAPGASAGVSAKQSKA